MYDLNVVRPVLAGPKLRLGKASDGGYVVLREQVEATRVLLSFGVATDWSFEEDFFRLRSGVEVLMFDASTSFPRILARLAAKTAKLDAEKALHYLHAALRYGAFIVLNGSVTFHRRFLADRRSRREVTFDDAIGLVRGPDPGPLGVFVKLDIEGTEYDVLPAIAQRAELINGLAVEFHALGTMGRRMEEVMAVLGRQFHVVHVHGNNYTGLVSGTALPTSLEVTMVNKSLIAGDPGPDPGPYPVTGLDFPNDPSTPDFGLKFR